MRPFVPVLVLLAVACGSAESGVVPPPAPPPPPPGGTVPAVLAVQAGDGQQAEPGAALTVKPMVAVKDSLGRGVAGVTVSFAVDSGGGSLQSTTATTAADGTAGPGDWHLGAAEGRNVMSASAASLTKIRFVATGVIGTRTVSDVSLTSGTIAVTADGPLKGTTLQIPAGAFASSTHWTLEQRAGTGWSLRPHVTTTGASLHVTSSADGVAAVPMTLTLPAAARAGFQRFILIRDESTGDIQVLPSTISDNASVTALAPHFYGGSLQSLKAGPAGGASLRVGGYDAMVVVAEIAQADIDADFDTGFRPGVDDWEFRPQLTEVVPSGLKFGKLGSAMAYFASRRSGGALWNKYQEANGLEVSNRVGIRASSEIDDSRIAPLMNDLIFATRNALPAAVQDQVFYSYLKASLLVTGLPQVLGASTQGVFELYAAYRVVSGKISFAATDETGDAGLSVQYANGAFGPLNGSPRLPTNARIGSASVGLTLNIPNVVSRLDKHVAHTTPASDEFFPSAQLNARTGFIDTDTLFAVDTTRIWLTCPFCQGGVTSALGTKVIYFNLYNPNNGGWQLASSGGGLGTPFNAAYPASSTRVGMLAVDIIPATGQQVWLDWRWLVIKKWDVTLPAGLTASTGSPQTYVATVAGPDMAAHKFVWTFGTGATATTVTTTGPSVTTTLTQVGDTPIGIQVLRLSDNKLLAMGSGTVTVSAPIPVWKFTSMTVTVTKTGALNLASGRYVVDSQRFVFMRDGTLQGALYILDQPFTRVCGACGPTALLQGVYILEGPSITAGTFNATPPFIGLVGANPPTVPAAPGVNGWPLVETPIPVPNVPCDREGSQGEFYQRTGDFTSGRITGKLVHQCTGGFDTPPVLDHYYASVVMAVDITFLAGQASGTLTGTYLTVHGPPNIDRVTITVTFQATRVTQ